MSNDALSKIINSKSLDDIHYVLDTASTGNQKELLKYSPIYIATKLHAHLATVAPITLQQEIPGIENSLKARQKLPDTTQQDIQKFNQLNTSYAKKVEGALLSQSQIENSLSDVVISGAIWAASLCSIGFAAMLFSKIVFMSVPLLAIPALVMAATFLANPIYLLTATLVASLVFAVPLAYFGINTVIALVSAHKAEKEIIKMGTKLNALSNDFLDRDYNNWKITLFEEIVKLFHASSAQPPINKSSYLPIIGPSSKRQPIPKSTDDLDLILEDYTNQPSNAASTNATAP